MSGGIYVLYRVGPYHLCSPLSAVGEVLAEAPDGPVFPLARLLGVEPPAAPVVLRLRCAGEPFDVAVDEVKGIARPGQLQRVRLSRRVRPSVPELVVGVVRSEGGLCAEIDLGRLLELVRGGRIPMDR